MTSPTSEPARIADQLRRAFEGDAWHGPALLEVLMDVDAATAAARTLPNVHSIYHAGQIAILKKARAGS